MSDPVLVAIIAAVPATIVAGGAVFLGILNRQGIKDLHISVNSRMDQLLEQKGLASKAEGKAEQRAETSQ